MARRRGEITRNEVTETVQKHQQEMSEKAEELDTTTSDVETERQTLESLDFGGTAEGADEVEQAIQDAENATVEVFERQDEELEEIQAETENYEQELQERSGSSESDLGKISDASGRIETEEGVNELVKAKEGVLQDIDFLTEQNERAREARDESDQARKEHEARIRAQKR